MRGTKAQEEIAWDIFREREKQTEKWGKQEHNLVEWMAILTEEVGEVAKEAVDYHFINPVKVATGQHLPATEVHQTVRLIDYRKELIQTMAVAMQMVEDLDERLLKIA